MLKLMTPKELADSWGIEEAEVMQKIHNSITHPGKNDIDKLPEAFIIKLKTPDTYSITVPGGYIFKRKQEIEKNRRR